MSANTYIIGLTGGIGCGKSEAAKYLESLGAIHVDADAISHELTAENGKALPAIRAAFGDGLFLPDGNLNRKAMAERIFSDKTARTQLEAILHPLVQKRALQMIDAAGDDEIVILDVPLLFECAMDVLCDEVWVMTLPPAMQLERLRLRDGLSEEQARSRIKAQMPAEERNARATRLIDTSRSIERTRTELGELYKAAVKTAKNSRG